MSPVWAPEIEFRQCSDCNLNNLKVEQTTRHAVYSIPTYARRCSMFYSHPLYAACAQFCYYFITFLIIFPLPVTLQFVLIITDENFLKTYKTPIMCFQPKISFNTIDRMDEWSLLASEPPPHSFKSIIKKEKRMLSTGSQHPNILK